MVHGLPAIHHQNEQAIARHAAKGLTPLDPAAREAKLQRLLATIDMAYHAGHLSDKSLIRQARATLGQTMTMNEANNVIYPARRDADNAN